MASTPNRAIVLAFCGAWQTLDVDAITAFLAEDAIWENVPMEVITGREAIAAKLRQVMASVSAIEFIVLHVAETETGVVLTERVDRIAMGEQSIELRLMGLFELRDGRITLWRDYFDLAQYRAQLGERRW